MIRGVDIVVRYSIFGYLLGEGFRNVFKNKKYYIILFNIDDFFH